MYLQHFGLEHPPFTHQPNPDVFFAQAGRKTIVKALRNDLQQGHAAILLTGPTGSGKTLFCRLIRHRLDGSSCKVVYLENPVGSFDDLLGQVCLNLGMPLAQERGQDMVAALHALLQAQKEQGRRVFLLIDEAEKMFLAAMERLFRLLHEVNEEYGVQVMLVGQPTLNISLEQLGGYSDDVRIASTYALEAFSVKETAAYLVYRLRVAGDERGIRAPLFSGEAVQEIFRLGEGIPGIMDGIAETALINAATAGADTVQPIHVSLPDPLVPPVEIEDEDTGGRRKGLLFLLALALLIFLFFGQTSFFLNQEDIPQKVMQGPIKVGPENTEISLGIPEDEEESLPIVGEDTGSVSPAGESSASPQEEERKKPPLFSLPIPQRLDFKKKEDTQKKEVVSAEPEALEEKGDADPVVSSEGQEVSTEVSIPSEEGGQLEDAPGEEVREDETQDVPEGEQVLELVEQQPEKEEEEAVVEQTGQRIMERMASPGEIQPATETVSSGEMATEPLATAKRLPVIKPTWIIELTPGMKKTRLPIAEESTPGAEPETKEARTAPPRQKTLVPVASARGVLSSAAPSVPEVEIPQIIQGPEGEKTPLASSSRSTEANQLFSRYLVAGNRWTKEKDGDKFTVQLLVLSSDDAVESIKDMIVREEYQEHKTNLYILRRNTLPPTIFVCYGVYSSMDEARNARNSMPLFLRKHHPYALSVSDVLAKARD